MPEPTPNSEEKPAEQAALPVAAIEPIDLDPSAIDVASARILHYEILRKAASDLRGEGSAFKSAVKFLFCLPRDKKYQGRLDEVSEILGHNADFYSKRAWNSLSLKDKKRVYDYLMEMGYSNKHLRPVLHDVDFDQEGP